MDKPMTDKYIVCVEHDGVGKEDGPISWETYLDKADIKTAAVKALQLSNGKRYGRVRIARLVFLDEEEQL